MLAAVLCVQTLAYLLPLLSELQSWVPGKNPPRHGKVSCEVAALRFGALALQPVTMQL
jgi:hypothetical protein